MAQDLTYVGLGNLTVKRGPNDELFVTGKATGDDLDLDQQICDATWLKSAMPLWFETGANVREQHSSIAAGVGIALENSGSDWYLKSEVVDPVTARKVERGVLRGYSIGIKGARVVKDASAPGGRIIDGQIVEISLVDRPANPTARIEIAKAVDGGSLELIKSDVMETERKPSARDNEELYPAVAVCPGCNGLGTITDNPGVLDKTCEICNGTGEKPRDWNADIDGLSVEDDDANHEIKTIVVDEPAEEEVIAEGDKPNEVEALPIEESKSLTVGEIKALFASQEVKKEVKHDEATLQSVRAGLIALMKAELDEMLAGEDDEVCDVKELLCALELFLCWWNGESEESETSKPFTMESEYENEDNMAFVGLGVSADLIKAATAVEASDTDKELLRDEVLKALGVADTIAETKATLEVQEETLKSLNAELAAIRELATPGGPAIRQTQTQAVKSADAERLQNDAARMRTLAAEVIDPIYKSRYLDKAEQLEADAKRVLRG